MHYKFTVVEKSEKTVDVKATSYENALTKIAASFESEEIKMSPCDFVGRTFVLAANKGGSHLNCDAYI